MDIPSRTVMRAVNTALVLCILLACSEAKRRLKVLVYSTTFSYSHIAFNGRLAEVLKNAGHEVHMLLPITDPGMKYDATKQAHRVFRVPLNHSQKIVAELQRTTMLDIINDKELINSLRAEKYDVGIAEALGYWTLGLFHVLGIPTTFGSSPLPMGLLHFEEFGIPAPSSFVPNWSTTVSINGDRLNLWERAQNVLFHTWSYLGTPTLQQTHQKMFTDVFGPDFPSVQQLFRNMSFLFVNSNPLFEISRPSSAKIVNIAGIGEHTPTRLSNEVASVLERSKKGTVFFSLGTLANTKLMPSPMKSAFLEAFAEFPEYELIWKDANAAVDRTPANVHFFDWVNQPAVLGHPRLKAFITHSGLNSVNEAAASGVPLVTMPLFGDQLYNAATAKSHGISVNLDVTRVTKDAIVDALKKVLEDPKYQENAHLLKRKLQTYPLRAEEQFLRHVEFAAEFPPLAELNLYGAELSFLEYHNLDLILAKSE
ncbi:Protein UGT-54 [Aphelenchoides avenae]|nr:Protein UGT-54 [Aphelenchus avenae]